MRRDITPDNGASLELRIWLITLCVLLVSVSLRYAIMSPPLDKGEASGVVLSKHYALTAMQLRAVRSVTKGGKGLRKFKEKMCISLPPRIARFRQFKPNRPQFKPNQKPKQDAIIQM